MLLPQCLLNQVLAAHRSGIIVGNPVGGTLALLPEGAFYFVDLALDLLYSRIIGIERRRQLGMLALEFGQALAQVLDQFILEHARQGLVLARLNQPVERFFFVSLGLRLG